MYLCKVETLSRRYDAPDTMDKVHTAAGRKFAQKHIDDAVENLLRGRRWDSQRRD